jgi:hypothetical protein
MARISAEFLANSFNLSVKISVIRVIRVLSFSLRPLATEFSNTLLVKTLSQQVDYYAKAQFDSLCARAL